MCESILIEFLIPQSNLNCMCNLAIGRFTSFGCLVKSVISFPLLKKGHKISVNSHPLAAQCNQWAQNYWYLCRHGSCLKYVNTFNNLKIGRGNGNLSIFFLYGVENYRFCQTPKRRGNLPKTVVLAISTVKLQKGHQPKNAQRINDLTKNTNDGRGVGGAAGKSEQKEEASRRQDYSPSLSV